MGQRWYALARELVLGWVVPNPSLGLKLAAPATTLYFMELYLHQLLLTDKDSISERCTPPAAMQAYVGCAPTLPLPQW